MVINYKFLYKIFTYENKIKNTKLKKNELKLINNSKYYYYLKNKDNIICCFYKYNNSHIIFFNGLLKKDIKLSNLFNDKSLEYYNATYDLIYYHDDKYNIVKKLEEKLEKLKQRLIDCNEWDEFD